MRKTTRLKELILDPEILVMPGAHDSLVARIIEQAGFQGVTLGGYPATANLLGKPDVSLLTMTEMVEYTRRICGAVDIPVFTDGDTGYGNVTNVFRTVKEMERAGAAGMFIEDQVFPKRCGHMEGKQVIPAEEMMAKIKAALDARTDPDFILMARTDALAVHGIEEAIRRRKLARIVLTSCRGHMPFQSIALHNWACVGAAPVALHMSYKRGLSYRMVTLLTPDSILRSTRFIAVSKSGDW